MSQENKVEESSGWFSKLVPSLIAAVTLVGALVAWRASEAGNTAGNLDAKGLLAVQNFEATDTRSYIKANQHRAAYVQYLRYRQYAESLAAFVPPEDATEAEVAALERRMKEDFDLAATSKNYFFPGRYLNQDGGYEFQLERDEENAAAGQQYDLDYETSFALSDRLGEKVLALLLMLVVLGVSLWFLALAEALENPSKYTLALGGLIFLLVGGIGAYLIDTETTAPKATADALVLATWIVMGVTVLVSTLIAILAVSRRTASSTQAQAQPAAVVPVQMQPPPPPMAPPGSPYYGAPQPPPQQPPASYPGYPPYPGPGAPMQSPVAAYQPPMVTAPVTPVAAPRRKINWDERLKPLITIMIATVALSATIITYLQTEASSNAGSANRNTQQFSLQGLSWSMFGEAARSYHFGDVALTWQQLETLAGYAAAAGEEETAARYRTVRDNLASTSVLYEEPYFTEGSSSVPDADSYIADNYTDTAIEYQELASAQAQVNNAWDGKAGAYIAMLTFLAVSLALFGLALTVSGIVRLLFVVVGLVIFANTLVLSISTYSSPVPNLPDEAITAYATGYALSDSYRYDEALVYYDEALAIAPDYANALVQKADALVSLDRYDEAIDVYKLAQAEGRDDTHVAWNLGWIYYLQGKFDDAIATDRHALDLDPNIVGIRLNLALALLSSGRYDEAEHEYNTAISRTYDLITRAQDRGETVSADFWFYLEAGVADLYNMVLRIEDFTYDFIQAPPRETVANPLDTETEAINNIITLRSKIMAFEYLAENGEMPPEITPDAQIADFEFSAVVAGQTEEMTGFIFPHNVKSIDTHYSYQYIYPGQRVAFKIYIDFQHYPEYDFEIEDWQNEESGDRIFTVTDPFDVFSETYFARTGLYTIEMYVDNQYVTNGFFYIQTAAEEAEAASTEP